MTKSFVYKVYDITGTTFQGLLEPKKVLTKIAYSHEVSGGQGELVINYNTEWDNPPVILSVGRVLKVYESILTDGVQTDRLVYTGYISKIQPQLIGTRESVIVICLGLAAWLRRAFFKDGASFSPAYVATDVADIFRDIVDHFNTVHGSILSYDAGSIPDTGNLIDYTFENLSHAKALAKAFEFAPTGYFWRVDADGKVYLQSTPGTATHRFVIGRDILEVTGTESVEALANGFLLLTGLVTPEQFYQDATSRSTYGIFEHFRNDISIDDQTTADNAGNALIADNKDPKNTPRIVIGPAFDFGAIRPGETCQVLNLKKGSGIFTSNMRIERIDVGEDKARLHLSLQEGTIKKAFTDAVKSLT